MYCTIHSELNKPIYVNKLYTDTLRPQAQLNTPTATNPTTSLSPMRRSVYLDFKGVGQSVIQSGVGL